MRLIRRYPVSVTFVVVAVVTVVGMLVYGPSFLTTALPLDPWVAKTWMLCNVFLAAIGMFTVYRKLNRYLQHWTWQEAGVLRATFLLVFAAFMGYLGRVFDGPTLTLGTPLWTAGILTLIWATIRPSVRIEGGFNGSPR